MQTKLADHSQSTKKGGFEMNVQMARKIWLRGPGDEPIILNDTVIERFNKL
jgi:hypothetical protein